MMICISDEVLQFRETPVDRQRFCFCSRISGLRIGQQAGFVVTHFHPLVALLLENTGYAHCTRIGGQDEWLGLIREVKGNNGSLVNVSLN